MELTSDGPTFQMRPNHQIESVPIENPQKIVPTEQELSDAAFLRQLAEEFGEDQQRYLDHPNGPYGGAARVCAERAMRLRAMANRIDGET